ncbi:MAG: hypothetical protein AAGD35_07885 [Actinomycetota bacterium]
MGSSVGSMAVDSVATPRRRWRLQWFVVVALLTPTGACSALSPTVEQIDHERSAEARPRFAACLGMPERAVEIEINTDGFVVGYGWSSTGVPEEAWPEPGAVERCIERIGGRPLGG